MNTKQILIAVAAAVALSAAAAMAQSTTAAAPATSAAAPASVDQDSAPKSKRHKMTFEEYKAKAVDRTEKRLACIKAANDRDAMKACSARKGKGGASNAATGAATTPAAAPAPTVQ